MTNDSQPNKWAVTKTLKKKIKGKEIRKKNTHISWIEIP